MFIIYILSLVVLLIILAIFYKPFRFYCYSYFLPWLYDHPSISKFLGIRYENDGEWKTNRDDSRVYIPGLIAGLLRIFIGMDFVLDNQVRHTFQNLQMKKARGIDMEKYFNRLEGNTINVEEFENFLSKSVIAETNNVFNIINKEKCEWLIAHSLALRTIISALTTSMWGGIKSAIMNFHHVIKMSLLLRSAPKETRILLIAPQLALIHNFTKMIVNKQGDMSDIQAYDFLEPVSRFFVAITTANGYSELVFVNRKFHKKNTRNNRAFGPTGLQCPGALYTFRFIEDVTKFLKALDIKIEGKPIYKGRRFSNISNKKDILITFNKKDNYNELVDNYENEELVD